MMLGENANDLSPELSPSQFFEGGIASSLMVVYTRAESIHQSIDGIWQSRPESTLWEFDLVGMEALTSQPQGEWLWPPLVDQWRWASVCEYMHCLTASANSPLQSAAFLNKSAGARSLGCRAQNHLLKTGVADYSSHNRKETTQWMHWGRCVCREEQAQGVLRGQEPLTGLSIIKDLLGLTSGSVISDLFNCRTLSKTVQSF